MDIVKMLIDSFRKKKPTKSPWLLMLDFWLVNCAALISTAKMCSERFWKKENSSALME
jgi:hypothetical protein